MKYNIKYSKLKCTTCNLPYTNYNFLKNDYDDKLNEFFAPLYYLKKDNIIFFCGPKCCLDYYQK